MPQTAIPSILAVSQRNAACRERVTAPIISSSASAESAAAWKDTLWKGPVWRSVRGESRNGDPAAGQGGQGCLVEARRVALERGGSAANHTSPAPIPNRDRRQSVTGAGIKPGPHFNFNSASTLADEAGRPHGGRVPSRLNTFLQRVFLSLRCGARAGDASPTLPGLLFLTARETGEDGFAPVLPLFFWCVT